MPKPVMKEISGCDKPMLLTQRVKDRSIQEITHDDGGHEMNRCNPRKTHTICLPAEAEHRVATVLRGKECE